MDSVRTFLRVRRAIFNRKLTERKSIMNDWIQQQIEYTKRVSKTPTATLKKSGLLKETLEYDYRGLNEFADSLEVPITKSLTKENPILDQQLGQIRANPNFVAHALMVMSHVQPSSKSLAEVVKNMPETHTIEGKVFSNMRDLLGFFIRYPFSLFSKQSQSDPKCEVNAATPMFLYAQRLYNNKPYEFWDKDIVGFFTNKELKIINKITFPEYDEDEYENLRIVSVTDGTGIRHGYSAYKCNVVIEDPEGKPLPRFFRHMYLKTWIFADPKPSMIIDLDNWDYTHNDIT